MTEKIELGWLEKKMKITYTDGEIVKFLDSVIQPVETKGDNYASRLFRIKVTALLRDGDKKEIFVILKRMLDFEDPTVDFARSLFTLFNFEHDVYSKILPHIESVLKADHEEESKFWADCYAFILNKDLYFQDLQGLGYRVGDRKKGLDLDHSELMLKGLGRFHAASMVCIDNGKINTTGFRPYFMSLNDEQVRNSLSPSFRLMSKVMLSQWGPEWKELALKVGRLPSVIFDLMHDSYKLDQSQINVINHGDFWVANCMFRYNSEGKPICLRFVDFQISHYNSYGWDLTYFLHTSVHTDLKEEHLDRLLSSYCESFKRTMKILKSALPCPTVEHAKSELLRLAPAAVTSSICIRPIIMSESDENFLKTEEIMSAHRNAVGKKEVLFKNPALTKVLKVDLNRLLSGIEA